MLSRVAPFVGCHRAAAAATTTSGTPSPSRSTTACDAYTRLVVGVVGHAVDLVAANPHHDGRRKRDDSIELSPSRS